MSTIVEPTAKNQVPAATRHEDLVLQVYCCVLKTLGGQTRMYQWLAHDATEQQQKASQELAKSYRSIIPVIMSVVVVGFGLASITALTVKSLEGLAKPFEIAQGIVKEGHSAYGNFNQADRTEEQAASERAQMFYQKFNRDESTADGEHSRLLQAISEIVRAELEAMRSMAR